MKLGQLNAPASGLVWTLTPFRGGGRIPCPPDAVTDGRMGWDWKNTMLTDVELYLTCGREVFVSLVRLELAPDCITAAEIFVPAAGGMRCVGAHRAETGRAFGGTVEITVGWRTDTLVIRLSPVLKRLEAAEPAVFGAVFGAPVLYPTPSRTTWAEGVLPLGALGCTADDGHPDSVFAAGYLRERAGEQWGSLGAVQGKVVFRHAPEMAADGYRLAVTRERVAVESSTRLGALYAAERLIELAAPEGIPCCVIEDAPYKPMRGFHIGLPPKEEIPFLKRLLRTILIPYHYNQLIIEFAGGMRFDSHPEISEAWLDGNRRARAGEIPAFPHGSMNAGGRVLEKADVRDLCDYARELGFELIPEIQSWGHVQYITFAHPEIAETDESVNERQMDTRDTDQPPSTFYYHSYCPQNEKSYQIIFDLMDEIVEVVRPGRFVHMGHDEIYQIGLCPKCKGVPHDQLYEKHVTALHGYLAKKGLRMMLWADMLQPTEKRYSTCAAVSRLPRDIVLLDFVWYFHFDLDLEDNLLPHGCEVVMGNLYSSHYPRYERRAAKPGMIGGQVSSWCRCDEYNLAKKGKLYDLMYTGEMLWSAGYRAECREAYAAICAARIPAMRDRLRGRSSVPRRWTALPLPVGGGRLPAALPGTPVLLDEPLTVPVNRRASALLFTHATLREERRAAWQPLTVVGRYTIRYTDGTAAEAVLEYGGNIRQYSRRWGEPMPEQYYRHQGYVGTWFADPVRDKDERGGDVTALALEWLNPHPEKEIAAVEAAEAPDSAAGVVVCGIAVR